MIKAFFKLGDREGKVKIDDLVREFRDYYVQQANTGRPLERSSSIMVYPASASDQAIKRLIITNPLERFLIKNLSNTSLMRASCKLPCRYGMNCAITR